MTTQCVDCKLKDRDLADRDRDISRLNKAVEEAQGIHESFGSLVEHAGSCPNCKSALEQHNARVIAQALENMKPEAVRELAIKKKAVPDHIQVKV